jgi:4-carboxymuconolactone decarboxylase
LSFTATAQRNHDALFPNHRSNLKVTDPELIEIFENFAFDEVLRESQLDVRMRLMVQPASMIAWLALREYRPCLALRSKLALHPFRPR